MAQIINIPKKIDNHCHTKWHFYSLSYNSTLKSCTDKLLFHMSLNSNKTTSSISTKSKSLSPMICPIEKLRDKFNKNKQILIRRTTQQVKDPIVKIIGFQLSNIIHIKH